MKKTAGILLFLFVAYLITPAVVCAMENDAEVSVASNFLEDEQVQKDVKLVFYFNHVFNSILSYCIVSKTILTKNSLKHDDVSLGIINPPPELI